MLRRTEHFNDFVDRVCLETRFTKNFELAFSSLIEKIHSYENDIQALKTEAFRNQQITINTSLREQNANQNYLEQIERLQRENFSLLQMRVSGNFFLYTKNITLF